jgi:dUTP pyrophosphatase
MSGEEFDKGERPLVKIRKKDPKVVLPQYETRGAAGMDLRAFIDKDISISPLGRSRIPTGLFMEIPQGFEAQVRPRSGLAAKAGVTVLKSPGTIDSDYRGELDIILINLGAETFTVKNNDRIAQLIIAPVVQAKTEETFSLSETSRGEGGFGSTGV